MERGLIVFEHVKDAFIAEKVLKDNGFQIELTLPPNDLVTGCDLAISFNLNEKVGVERILAEKNVRYSKIVDLIKFSTEPLKLVKKFDYSDTIMFRCGAMKITIDKADGTILNISGGGCPDVPYLFLELVGKKIFEAKNPTLIGYSLCAYSLAKAFEEALNFYENSSRRNRSS
ncbi:MAG: DUF3343 domain-containing protein [Nitrososphaeria archaeon]